MILLSLDQLEQALDGGSDPVVPPRPAPPEPPATPSFVPEDALPHASVSVENVHEEPVIAEETSEQDDTESSLVAFAEEADSSVEERSSFVAPPSIRALLPEIIVPPTSMSSAEALIEPPASTPQRTEETPAPSAAAPLPQLDDAPAATPISGERPPAALSREERFFLEY